MTAADPKMQQIVDLVDGSDIPQPVEAGGEDFLPDPNSPSGCAGAERGADDFGDPKVLEACAALDQNDTDNGKRLLAHFGGEALHVREVGWHTWTGTHWEYEGGQEAVERLAQETARRIKLEGDWLFPTAADSASIEKMRGLAHRPIKELTEVERAELEAGQKAAEKLAKRKSDRRKFAVSSGNRARTVAMIAQAAPHRTVPPAKLDAEHMLFNVANGTLRFRRFMEEDFDCPDPDIVRLRKAATIELIPHDREHCISKIAPWVFDEKATCPKLEAFLERFQPNKDSRRFLQVAAGRALLGGASSQVMIFLYGDGANGKSVFMETLARMLAAYAGRLKPESITGAMEQSGDKATPDFARLQGKRFVAIAELPRGAPLREGLVKTMTGSEPMPVRHLNHGFFDLTPEFIPWMSGNQMPEIGGLDSGIWRRLKFVLWPVKIPEEEQKPLPEVVEDLLSEASGILNWLIEGALIFLREGLVDPEAVRELGAEHRSDLDPVANFLRDCVRASPGGRVQARQLYEGFVSYCRANAIRDWKEKSFAVAMKQKGYVREDKRIRYWLDVELYGVPERPDSRAPDFPEGYGG
jgi:putative DNA primase/helicase